MTTHSMPNSAGRDVPPDVEGRSVGDLVGEIAEDVSRLLRQEIDLAKAEAKQEVTKLGKGAGMLGGAGVAGHLLLLFASVALMLVLGRVMDLDLAALIVAVIWAVVAAVLAVDGSASAQVVRPPAAENHPNVEGGCAMGEDTDGLRRDIQDTRGELTRDVDALTEKVRPSRILDRGVQRTRDRMSDMKDRVMGGAEDAAGSVRDGVSSAGETVTDTASDAAVAVKEKTRGNPLAAGLIAFGAGWLVSSLLPASEKETQLASKAVDTAKEYGQPLAHEAADVAAEIGQDMKSPAQEAVQSVKSTAADAASTVKDEGRSSASTIADQAKPSSS